MNILIMTDYYPPGRLGGIGEVAAGLYEAYRRLGHSVYVLSTGVEQAGERERGIWRSCPKLVPGIVINNFLAPRLIREFSIDLVHMQQASSTLFALVKRRERKPRILYTLHVSYADEAAAVAPYRLQDREFRPSLREYLERVLTMPVHRVLDAIGAKEADFITTMSRGNCAPLRDARVPLSIVPNGCDLPKNLPQPENDPALLSFIEGRRVVAISGSFRTRKRLPLLLLAFKQLVQTHTEVALLVMGGGHGYEAQMVDLSIQLDLEEHVWFAGHIAQPRVLQHLQLADIFCMISILEGMPVALMEAMSLGLAVVGTRIPGIIDAIDDGETGLLVDVDDVDDLTVALRRLLDDEVLRVRLGSAAAKRVQENFNWNIIARQYLAAVESVF